MAHEDKSSLLGVEREQLGASPMWSSGSEEKAKSGNSYGGVADYSKSTSSNSFTSEVSIPLKLYPFAKRLGDLSSELTQEDVCKILFIVRIADALNKVGYATFLTLSLVEELKKKLEVPDLDLEIEIAALRWSYQQGAVTTYHRIAVEYDGSAMQILSRIALGVLGDSITVAEGLERIQRCRDRQNFTPVERMYRRFPGRLIVMPILTSTSAVVYFGGTAVDFLFCILTGLVAGWIQNGCTTHPQMAGMEEILVAATTASLSTMAAFLFPDSVCFPAQVLGSLVCFYYGIAFVLSLYEITQNFVLTGLARFCLATMKTFVLAFGVVIGLWAVEWFANLSSGFMEKSIVDASSCTDLRHAIDPFWFNFLYPGVAIGTLMHLRVSPKHWPICLLTQLLTVKSQYLLSAKWGQPVFISNLVPAFLATLTAHVLIVTGNALNLTRLNVKSTAFFVRHSERRQDVIRASVVAATGSAERRASTIRFVDGEWADQGETRAGFRRSKLFQYQRSDLWFCLVPSLSLLVPGAAIWRVAFFSIVESPGIYSVSSADSEASTSNFSFQTLAAGIFVIGIGQAIGVRLAFATLWGVSALQRRCRTRRD